VVTNYRTDEQLRAILAGERRCIDNPLDQVYWLSANLQNIVQLVRDPAQSELLKKLVAGFHVSPIK
jgi:hypothetical protein